MERIARNATKCSHCGGIIVSAHCHGFVTCGCCPADGGNDYLRRGFINSIDDFTEMSGLAEEGDPWLAGQAGSVWGAYPPGGGKGRREQIRMEEVQRDVFFN